jgi:CheY-like chemotaxis protein
LDGEGRSLRELRILLVEDEFLIADYLADLITEAGHSVAAITSTGQEALSALENAVIDLAICDIKLKGDLSGIDVAKAASARGIAHFYVSGSGDPATRSAAELTKPLAFLQKPVSRLELRQILTALSGRDPQLVR